MTLLASLPLALSIAASPAPALAIAAPGGMLGVLETGVYRCFLPGDAAGEARRVVAEEGFTITNSSTYTSGDDWGTYLLTGKRVVISRGPMKGATYLRESRTSLRKLDTDGRPSRLLCTRIAPPPR